jgi:hypothetical protein
MSTVKISPQIERYIRNPNSTGGSTSESIRAEIQGIFSSNSIGKSHQATAKPESEVIDLDQSTGQITDLGEELSVACSKPASKGVFLSCEYSSQNFLSGNYFYVWKKRDLCNPGFRCGANNLGIQLDEHCAKAYRGVAHNVLPRQLGCFE